MCAAVLKNCIFYQQCQKHCKKEWIWMLAKMLKEKEEGLFNELKRTHSLLKRMAVVFELNAIVAAFNEEIYKSWESPIHVHRTHKRSQAEKSFGAFYLLLNNKQLLSEANKRAYRRACLQKEGVNEKETKEGFLTQCGLILLYNFWLFANNLYTFCEYFFNALMNN